MLYLVLTRMIFWSHRNTLSTEGLDAESTPGNKNRGLNSGHRFTDRARSARIRSKWRYL